MMFKVMAVVALLAAAQILPSCDGPERSGEEGGVSAEIVGWVAEKRKSNTEFHPFLIVINQLEYGVPYEFWLDVEVGDLVKRERGRWSIVRRARG